MQYLQAWQIKPWDKNLSLKRNKRWINDKMKESYTIYDIGLDKNRSTRSDNYRLESQRTSGYSKLIKIKTDDN